MTLLRAAGSLAILWGIGALLLSSGGWRRAGPAGWGADFAAGVLALAGWGTVLAALQLPLSPLPVYLTGLVLAVAAARRKRPPAAEGLRRVRAPADRVAGAVVVAAAALVLWILVASTVDRLWWDGWAIWSLKAHILYIAGTLPDTLADPAGPYAFTHPDYPLALPLLDWWVFRHAGKADPALASFTGAVLFGLLPLVTWGGLADRIHARLAAAAALGVAGFWPVSFYASGGTADVIVALGLLGAVVELERGVQGGMSAGVWRAGFFLALAALTKNEGLALSVAVLGVGLWTVWRGQVGARRLFPLLLPFVVLAPWHAFRLSNGLVSDTLAAPSVGVVIARAPSLFTALALQLSTLEWLPPTFIALLALSWLWRSRGWPALRMAWLVVGGYSALVGLVYLTSPQEIDWLLVTSLPRVLGAVVPATVFTSLLTLYGSQHLGDVPRGDRHAAR